MTRKKISLCYKIITVASLIIGITLNLWNRDASAVISMLSYYTLQSNIICLVAFVFFIIKDIRGKDANDIYYLVKGAIVIAIIITAVVYRLALAPNSFEMDSLKQSITNKAVANFFVHTLSPILVFFDYVLFDEKGNFKKYYPIIWLVIPLQYVFYVYTYSWRGGKFYGIGGSRKYAYPFLDYELIGYDGVIMCMIIFGIAILLVSYLLVLFDYIRGKKKSQINDSFFVLLKLTKKYANARITLIGDIDMYNNDKIVIFDWGGIVESHREGEYNHHIAISKLINKLNPDFKKDIIKTWEECDNDENGRKISTFNEIEHIEKWYERVKSKFNLECDFKTFVESYNEELDKIYFYKDIVELEHLTKQRCKIAILSNLILLDRRRLNNQVNLEKFDYVWLSYEMGTRKPNKNIYEMVENECKIEPQNILFIDDTDENIKMAKEMGWNTCKACGYEYDKINQAIEKFLK